MLRKSKDKGFTLVEILVVIIILGVMAGLAVPVMTSQVEKSRAEEAIRHLDAVKGSLLYYHSLNKSYAGATFSNLKYDPNVSSGGQTVLFSYTLLNLGSATYTIRAQREPAVSNAGNTIILDQTGTITKNGAYA